MTSTHTPAPTPTLDRGVERIELHHVTRHFDGRVKRAFTGGTPALDDITTSLPGGKVYGLIGRNGAGKTTLLRALAGQLRVHGEIFYDGKPVWDNPEVLDRLILTGSDVPWPDFTVKRLMRVAATRFRTWDQAYADRLVADFELDTSKSLSELSRGQKSLANIVIGLASQCPITFLDEPYLGLDVQNREMFYHRLLADVERNPRTLIISTHHIDDASRVLDAVILLDQGRITGVGELEEFTERVAILSGSATAVESQLAAMACDASAVLTDATSGGIRRVCLDLKACPSSITMTPARLSTLLEGSGVRMQIADLEQAVLALTGRELAGMEEPAGAAGPSGRKLAEQALGEQN